MLKRNNGQSIVEYAILLGVVIAALLIMQVFIKRGYQGGLKDSADKMGDQFSAGGTTIYQNRTMAGNQTIKEEVGTGAEIEDFTNQDIKGTVASDVYSYTERSGAPQTAETKTRTDSAVQEKTRTSEYQNTSVTDYTLSP